MLPVEFRNKNELPNREKEKVLEENDLY